MRPDSTYPTAKPPMAFPLKVTALPMESAPGFLLRAFEINGEPWSRERLKGRDITLSDVMMGGGARIAAELTGTDPRRFTCTTAEVRSKKLVVVGGEELHRDDWSTLSRRWCPDCFRDDLGDEALGGRKVGWRPHRRFWWDAACVLTCPVHGILLASACTACRREVTWEGGSLTTCQAGHSLMVCEVVGVEAGHVRADLYVLGRLGARQRVPAPFLDALPLRDAHDVMERLGCAALGGAQGALSKFPVERRPEVLSAGFDVAAGWPQAFDGLLDRLASAPGIEVGSAGADQVYGYLVMWARSITSTLHGKAILDAVHAHQARRSSVRTDWAASAFTGDDSPRNLAQLAEATGRTSTSMAAYLKAMGHWPEKTRRGSPVPVPRPVFDELVSLFADAVTMSDIAEILGTDDIRVRTLVETGLLSAEPLHAKAGKTPLFSKAKILAWVEGLGGAAPVVTKAEPPLKGILQAGRFAKVGGVAGVVRLVLSGNVRVRARLSGAVGLNAILVDPADIQQVRFDEAGVTYGLKEAAKHLGVHLETAAACVEEGLLAKVMLGKQKIGITQEAVDAFKAAYVTAKELAEPLGTLNRYVIEVLTDAGIKPILSTKENVRTRVSIYKREIIPFNLKSIYKKKFSLEGTDQG